MSATGLSARGLERLERDVSTTAREAAALEASAARATQEARQVRVERRKLAAALEGAARRLRAAVARFPRLPARRGRR